MIQGFVALQTLRLRVLDPPVAKARPRAAFNGGKPRIYTPSKTSQAEWRIRTAFSAAFPAHQPWDAAVALTVTAWLQMPRSISSRKRATAVPIARPDTDNYLKTVLDALNGVAYVDDSRVISVMCTKAYALDGPAAWDVELALIAALNPATEVIALDKKGAPARTPSAAAG